MLRSVELPVRHTSRRMFAVLTVALQLYFSYVQIAESSSPGGS